MSITVTSIREIEQEPVPAPSQFSLKDIHDTLDRVAAQAVENGDGLRGVATTVAVLEERSRGLERAVAGTRHNGRLLVAILVTILVLGNLAVWFIAARAQSQSPAHVPVTDKDLR